MKINSITRLAIPFALIIPLEAHSAIDTEESVKLYKLNVQSEDVMSRFSNFDKSKNFASTNQDDSVSSAASVASSNITGKTSSISDLYGTEVINQALTCNSQTKGHVKRNFTQNRYEYCDGYAWRFDTNLDNGSAGSDTEPTSPQPTNSNCSYTVVSRSSYTMQIQNSAGNSLTVPNKKSKWVVYGVGDKILVEHGSTIKFSTYNHMSIVTYPDQTLKCSDGALIK